MKLLRRITDVLVITLALNFIAMAVAIALLAQRAQLDREKIGLVRDVLFPSPPEEIEEPPPEPPREPTPMEQLIALLDAQSGQPAEQRVADLRKTVDERLAALDRTRRELTDRQRQIDLARRRLGEDRAALELERQQWEEKIEIATARAQDAGFRQTLELYEQMQPRQAKSVFMQLEDETVLAFLREMEPRTAGRILREFRDEAEVARLRGILELMRQGDPAAADAIAREAVRAPRAGNDPW